MTTEIILQYVAIGCLTGLLGWNIFRNKKTMSYINGMILISYLFMV